MTFQITWDNLIEITDNSKKVIGQHIDSLDSLNAVQNVLIAALGAELDALSEQKDEVAYTVAAAATENLWGNLYQCEKDTEILKNISGLVTAFSHETEDRWLTLMWLMAVAKFSLEAGVHLSAEASENGNTNAIEHLATHKKNLAVYDAIMTTVIEKAVA